MQATRLSGSRLSIQQERLWELQAITGYAYRSICTVQVQGPLRPDLFAAAIQRCVERHEVLRTLFRCLPGTDVPVQVVMPDARPEWPVVCLETIDSASQLQELHKLTGHLELLTFDREHGPLLRLWLIRLSEETHVLLICLPALCADASTLRLFVEELGRCYVVPSSEQSAGEEPLQYADVAAWQDELLHEESAGAHRQYWRRFHLEQLATRSIPFVPPGRARSVDLKYRKDHAEYAPAAYILPEAELFQKNIAHCAQQYDCSPFSWLLTCWLIVLSRLNDDPHALVGVACDGRVYEELSAALGPYTRFIPFSVYCEPGETFAQMLALVHDTLQQCIEKQLYFDQEAGTGEQDGRETSRYFPLGFSYQRCPEAIQAGELMMLPQYCWSHSEPCILQLNVLQIGERFRLELRYEPGFLASASISRLALSLIHLLQVTMEQPQSSLADLPLLSSRRQDALLQQFRSPEPVAGASTLLHLFERQAQLFAERVALCDEQQLTYGALDRYTTRVARVLRQHGVGPGVLVGLALPRSLAQIVGLLAVWKAGGGYVPLELEHPRLRLTEQLKTAKVGIVLTQEAGRSKLQGIAAQIVLLENALTGTPTENASPLPLLNQGSDVAYVMFTSGSTGQPKGVLIQHGSVLSYTQGLCERLGIQDAGWHFATVSTLAADLGNTVIFASLSSGGCLHVFDYAAITSGQQMARLMRERSIDVLKIVPSHLSALLGGSENGEVLPQRALILGGEVLSAELLRQVRQRQALVENECRIYNHYGPTETTIGVLLYALPEQADNIIEAEGNVPLGQALPGSEVMILDWSGQVVPIGVTGELYLGGAGVALGYMGQADLTAERFVPHPFSKKVGARLYRSGDLGRYREEGVIEYVGRADQQIKVRGYRVEPGEIETVLRRHAQVREAVVQEGKRGDLVGYVVPRGGGERLRKEELEWAVREALPEYMLPGNWAILERLPLTQNGKIDRQRLREWEPLEEAVRVRETRDDQEQVQGPIEEIVQEIWRDLLDLQEIGRHENFFQLGGHSLLATRLLARLQALLQVELPIISLFEAPTIAQLSQRIEHAWRMRDSAGTLPPLEPISRARPLPLSFAQQRLWFLHQLEPDNTSYNKLIALTLKGSLHSAALERCLDTIVQRHESLRTTFAVQEDQPVQIIRSAGSFRLPLVDLSGLGGARARVEARKLVERAARSPFDLAKGPLLRSALLYLHAQEHVLLLAMHHIVSDGWSTSVFMRELKLLYQAFVRGESIPASLPALPVQYADFAVWQRQWLRDEVLATQVRYWQDRLRDVTILDLPTDYPRSTQPSFRGGYLVRPLPSALSKQLATLSQQENVTQFMLLLAAFQVLLARYSGQHDICVGTPIANRTHTHLEHLIGFFVNTLVLRVNLSRGMRFDELLQQVREVALGAYEHQDVPFEHLVEVLQPERDMSRSPLFQVMFGVQQASPSGQALAEATIEEFDVEHEVTKFDLTWNVVSGTEGLSCGVEYRSDLFSAATIERMLEHWQALLEGIVHNPRSRLGELPLLVDDERKALLARSLPQRPGATPACLPALFAGQVARAPDALAVHCSWGDCLSYDALFKHAKRLATFLRQQGVGPERLLGVFTERNANWLVALSGIWLAHGGYVPLDPDLPVQRLRTIVQTCNIGLLLCLSVEQQQQVQTWLPSSCRLFLFDDCFQSQNEEADACLSEERELSIEQAAYVIHTSGSTGEPKGVLVSHRGLATLAAEQRAAFGLDAGSRVLQFASASFDASIAEIVVSWLAGACLVLAEAEALLPGHPLIETVARESITALTLPPSVLAVLSAEEAEECWKTVETLVVAGEACRQSLVDCWAKPERWRLCNAYGPSEATVCASIEPRLIASEPVSIGQALAGVSLYVLDAEGGLTPDGVIGELCLGGSGLAREYVQRPELTAERFVPDPYSSQAGARLYRTGDRVKWGVDGRLQYIGRTDGQVKLRGYRVELGEIEAVLARHPRVQEAVALLRGEESEERQLQAYVLLEAGHDELREEELRDWLRQRLPGYMQPGQIVHLEQWPRTSSGKIDRRKLREYSEMERRERRGEQQESGQLERLLQEIWSEVLGDEEIGVEENFFELGGHSLLATQIVGRVQKALGIVIPLQRLFAAPTIASFARSVEQMLRGEQQSSQAALPLHPVSRAQELQLSFAQQRLWFLDQLEPGNTVYLIPCVLRLQGTLDAAVLARSLGELIRRHEVLRTVFETNNGQPLQIIQPAPTGSILPVIDLQALPEEQRRSKADELLAQEVQLPFDLSRGPLLRPYLLRLHACEHLLTATMHHMIADGRSYEVFVEELTTLYRAFLTGQPSPLPALPIQYADFANWQRQWLPGALLETQLNYWLHRLADLPHLELPTDHPRPPVQTYRGATEELLLPEKLHEQLKVVCQQQYVTLFMLLLSAFAGLLARLAGQSDIAIGAPISGRTLPELEGLIGFFVNTLIIRVDLADNPSFLEILERVRAITVEAYAHQDIPFEYIVEHLQPQRDTSRSPLFQVSFSVQHIANTVEHVEELVLSRVPITRPVARFDLNYTLVSSSQGLHCFLEYNTDLFDAATIRRWLSHWQVLLEGIAARPGSRLSELPLMTETELARIVSAWNTTRAAQGDECSTLHELFEQQALVTPDSMALLYGDQHLTYERLDHLSNQLASMLRARGASIDCVVGVCLPRSLNMVVALLGILKTGGAYVPLDATLPRERLRFQIADAGLELLITTAQLGQIVMKEHPTPVHMLFLEREWESIQSQRMEPLACKIPGDALAYVIYTSGSTGVPKGVMVTQRGLYNYVYWASRHYEVELAHGSIVHSSIGFDLTLTSLFLPLLTGRSVRLVPEEHGIEGFVQNVREHKHLSLLKITPAHLEILSHALPVDELPEVAHTLVIGGEALLFADVDRWRRYAPHTRLINEYGPTETVVGCCIHEIATHEGTAPAVPIGHPIANTQLFILDAFLQPVAIGVTGELYIGGAGVARGYMRRPDLTAERFLPDPFSTEAGARLYKSGDLARYRADGIIEYLGRGDQQVKLRGYRIELEEIEEILRGHPSVQDAAILVHEDAAGEKCLVGYVVYQQAAQQPLPGSEQLRDFLRAYLAEYMIPTVFVALASLPLTPNGKLDRHALPAPDVHMQDRPAGESLPRTSIEEMLLEVWRETLNVKSPGVRDDFFAMGGHSLLAMRLIARLRSLLRLEIPLRSVFEAPRIVDFARVIERAMHNWADQTLPPLLPVARDHELPLSFAQQRLWFLAQLEPENPAYLVPLMQRLQGPLDIQALQKSVEALIARHESLRTRFIAREGVPMQVIQAECAVVLPLVSLQALEHADREKEARKLAYQEAMSPLSLEQAPLLRGCLLRLERHDHVLILILHHITYDGWSNLILQRELDLLYQALTTQQRAVLPPLPIQYADYAVWQRSWLQGDVLEALLVYWKRQLADSHPLELLPDYPRPLHPTSRGAFLSFPLPDGLQEKLVTLGKQEHVTLFILLLAAFNVLLAHYTDQSDICLGTVTANRTQGELEKLIGFFVNTLVLRTDLAGNPTFLEALQRVREVALGAYAYQDMPFELLVEALQPERDLNRPPLVRILFGVMQQFIESEHSASFSDLRRSEFTFEHLSTKFDMTFTIVEHMHGMSCHVEYNADLFEQATIVRLCEHWSNMLREIVADPSLRISDFSLLSASELQTVLVDWNATARSMETMDDFKALFASQVALRPDAIAVTGARRSGEEVCLSYQQLDWQANRLAHYLQSVGVSPEVLVGVMTDRSLELVICFLAVLKAGGVYVPMEPSYPPARLAYMLSDTRVSLLLTSHAQAEIPIPEAVPLIGLDEIAELLRQQPLSPPESPAQAENAAYVIYTSGSTGTPKGVVVPYRGLGNLARAQATAFAISERSRVLQFASLSFDAAISELVVTLGAGATLCVAARESLLPGPELLHLLRAWAITLVTLPPSALAALAVEALPLCETLVVAGEECWRELVADWAPGRRFCNAYGPTEMTVCASIAEELVPDARKPAIGRAFAHTRLYVCDARMQPVATGVPGELYIGGIGEARGYLNQAAQTAQRFVPDPFAQKAGSRLYRTGDRVRYRQDGSLEYLGRVDRQVKVRGYRIELEEIEAVLQKHLAIQACAVLVREDSPGDQRVIAYASQKQQGDLSEEELRRWLGQHLPEYMLPSHILLLEELPLTPGGKIDRQSLLSLESRNGRAASELELPRTPLEEQLLELWCEVLGKKQVGIEDSFFELGGHSLLATRLIARVQERLGMDLPVYAIFEAPTVAQFASVIEEQQIELLGQIEDEELSEILGALDK